jgi:hypothetical protein
MVVNIFCRNEKVEKYAQLLYTDLEPPNQNQKEAPMNATSIFGHFIDVFGRFKNKKRFLR